MNWRRKPRLQGDLERLRRADEHLKNALEYLRKSENTDRLMTLIAGIRRLREQLEVVLESALPHRPGEEERHGFRRG
jgi:hypothetical protein